MKRILLILVLVVVARVGYADHPDTLTVKQQVEIIDSLYQSVMAIYPLELLDSIKWRKACEEGKIKVRRTEDLYYFLGNSINKIGKAGNVSCLSCIEPKIDRFGFFKSEVKVNNKDNLGQIVLGLDYGDGNIALTIDSMISMLEQTDGLILDLRPMSYSKENVIILLSRLFNQKIECLKTHQRIFNTNNYIDSIYTIEPQGKCQYQKPIVVLISQWGDISKYLMEYSLTKRSDIKIIGETQSAPRGIYSIKINLGYEAYVDIPTTTLQTPDGKSVPDIIPDIYVEERWENGKNIVYERGLRELKKMTGKE